MFDSKFLYLLRYAVSRCGSFLLLATPSSLPCHGGPLAANWTLWIGISLVTAAITRRLEVPRSFLLHEPLYLCRAFSLGS